MHRAILEGVAENRPQELRVRMRRGMQGGEARGNVLIFENLYHTFVGGTR